MGGFQPLPPPLFYCCGLTAPRRGFCIGSPQLWDPRFGVFPYSLTAPLCSYGMRAALQNQRPALSTAPKPSDCSATASSAASCESRPPKAPKRPHRPHKPPSAPPQTTPRPPPPGAKHPQAAAIPPSLGARLFVHEVEQSEAGSNYIPSLKTRRGFVPLSRANPTEPHFDLPPPPPFLLSPPRFTSPCFHPTRTHRSPLVSGWAEAAALGAAGFGPAAHVSPHVAPPGSVWVPFPFLKIGVQVGHPNTDSSGLRSLRHTVD